MAEDKERLITLEQFLKETYARLVMADRWLCKEKAA